MNKAYIFGDCHTCRLWENYNPDSKIKLLAWGKGGTKIWDLNLQEKIDKNEVSSGTERSAKFLKETLVSFADLKDGDLILPWLGYVDIRQFLPKYKNADELAKYYVDIVIAAFPNSKIKFIEPLPQFTEMLLKHEGISPSYEYSERLDQNNQFIAALNKYVNLYKLEKPITQQQILNTLGVKEFTTDMTPTDYPHPVDALRSEDMEKIYNLVMEEISNTLNIVID